MKTDNRLAILVLTCDAYSDLWDDFFNLRDKYWTDCPYKWYLVTELKDYDRKNVEVIKCGKELNWAGRFRMAVQTVNFEYIGVYLEDYFIKSTIDNNRIERYLNLMATDDVKFLNLGDVFHHIIDLKGKEYYATHLIRIPKHLRYGIDTAAAIWNKEYLLEILGEGDYTAWQFELDRCREAASEEGLKGLILCDDLNSFNVSEIPVVIQGAFYPEAKKFFEKECGYKILSTRKTMGFWNVSKFKLKMTLSKVKYGRKTLKWLGTHLLGYTFFTED